MATKSLRRNFNTELEKRFETLERRVATLEAKLRVADADESLGVDDFLDSPKKRGRKQKLSDSAYRYQFNNLSWLFQAYWPELMPIFNHRKPDADRIIDALKQWENEGSLRAPLEHLRENKTILVEFLASDRYNRDPGNLALAMAGVPYLTWRASMFRGRKIEKTGAINSLIAGRALPDHFRRKHPAAYRALCSGRFEEAASQLTKSATKCCKYFGGQPTGLKSTWETRLN